MSEGATKSTPARAWGQGLARQNLQRFVVQNLAVLDDAVVTFGRVRVHRHVSDQGQLRKFRLQLAQRPRDQASVVHRLLADLVLERVVDARKQAHPAQAQRFEPGDLRHQQIERHAVDAGQGRDRLADAVAFFDEHRPDQIAGEQHRLLHKVAQTFEPTQAAGSFKNVHGTSTGR